MFAKGSLCPEYGKVFIVKSKILKNDMEEIFRFPYERALKINVDFFVVIISKDFAKI